MKNFFRLPVIIGTLPVTLTNGTTADATQVMSDLSWIVNQTNANAAPLANTALTNANNNFTVVQSGQNATAAAHFPVAQQVQDRVFNTLSSTLGTNTLTARIAALPLGAYAIGQVFTFVPPQRNTASATMAIDGLGSAVFQSGGRNLLSGELGSGTAIARVSSVGAMPVLDLINVQPSARLRVVRKIADELVTNSTTLQDDDDLKFSIAPNEEWTVDYFIDAGGLVNTSGISVAITVPSGALLNMMVAVDFGGNFRTTTSGAAITYAAGSVAGLADALVKISAWVLNGPTAGSVTLQFAQGTNVGTPLTFRKGSHLVANRIS